MKSMSLILLAGAALGAVASADDNDQAYRAEMLADAAQRTSLLAAGATLTHDNGHFTMTDASGNNSMYLGLYGEARYLFNFGNEERFGGVGDAADGDVVNGFQISRVKLFAGGTVGSSDFEYYYQFGANGLDSGSSMGGGLYLEDFWGKFNFDGGSFVRVGQGRPSQGFEAGYQPWELQSFERSLGHALFGIDRTQFIEVGYQSEDQTFDITGFVMDGMRTANVNFTGASEADIGLGGRANFYFAGDASDFAFQSSTADRTDYAGRAGIGGSWETHGETGIGTPDFDLFTANADVEVKGEAWSAGVHAYLINIDPDVGTDGTHFAFRVRGGYNVTEDTEVYAFWDSVLLDDDVLIGGSSADDNFNFVGVGANFYPIADSRAVQLGFEVIVATDDTSDLFGNLSTITVGPAQDFSLYNLLGDTDTEVGVGGSLSILN